MFSELVLNNFKTVINNPERLRTQRTIPGTFRQILSKSLIIIIKTVQRNRINRLNKLNVRFCARHFLQPFYKHVYELFKILLIRTRPLFFNLRLNLDDPLWWASDYVHKRPNGCLIELCDAEYCLHIQHDNCALWLPRMHHPVSAYILVHVTEMHYYAQNVKGVVLAEQ